MAEAIARQRGPAADRFFTSDVAIRPEAAWQRVRRVIPPFEWPLFAPDVDSIQRLKRERHAVVLAHNSQTPAISPGLPDIVGDSLALPLTRAVQGTRGYVRLYPGCRPTSTTT